MTGGHILWAGRAVGFAPGESVASALMRARVLRFADGPARGVFCGIGQCQNCLVQVDGRTVEACLTPCRDGMAVLPGIGGVLHG